MRLTITQRPTTERGLEIAATASRSIDKVAARAAAFSVERGQLVHIYYVRFNGARPGVYCAFAHGLLTPDEMDAYDAGISPHHHIIREMKHLATIAPAAPIRRDYGSAA